MRVLCTGAAGYIGSVVVERLLAAGHEPIALDDLRYGVREAVPRGITFWQCNLAEACDYVFRREAIDAVVHLAAESAIPLSMRDPSLFYQVNVQGGINLLEAMRFHRVKKFVFSSTSSVYHPEAYNPLCENSRTGPSSPYGESKLAFERALHWYQEIHGFQPIIFRYFNVNGATPACGERPYHQSRIISVALNVALGKLSFFPLYGRDYTTPDGTCVRDYLHVDDVARAHVLALDQCERLAGNIFNLGIGKSFSNLEVIESVRRVTGHPIPVADQPRRPGDPPRLTCDPTKANKVLGWEPEWRDLDAIVESAWRWQQQKTSE